MKVDIIICGVGGQGVLLASEVLGNLAILARLDVKKSEIHGMAQRGGSVFSHLRIGEKVNSPVIPLGSADFMLAFEELEALRYAPYLKKDGVVLVNRQRISPLTVLSGDAKYPENPVAMMKEHFERVFEVNALELAKKAGSPKAVNMVMIGALSKFLDWDESLWLSAMERCIPQRFLSLNQRAFSLGRAG